MAVPVTAEKESKITSTLRRLSVVRRKSKNKMRPNKADAKGIEEEPQAEASGNPGGPVASASSEAAAGSARPSSTTSRDSENDVVTSGYFRLKIR